MLCTCISIQNFKHRTGSVDAVSPCKKYRFKRQNTNFEHLIFT